MASIIVITGSHKGDYYTLGRRTTVIGRDEALPVQILDERVSRKHLKIYFDAEKDQYYAKDMDSKHGVFINGMKIRKDTPLVESDGIVIGKTTLLFTLESFSARKDALLHYKKVGQLSQS